MLPDCEKLPPIGSKGSETCFRIGIPHITHVVPGKGFLVYTIFVVLKFNLAFSSLFFAEQSCYNDDGRDYRGVASRTTSKQDCIPWNRQLTIKSSEHPELIGGHNFCRNPGGIEIQPWCFVEGGIDGSQRPRREFCSLPKCCKIKLIN
jgi:receptor tyrosine kinase-like orphan receptor 1